MNILYISFLKGKLFRGPTYSVPNQILAQSKYDNVFWYNITFTEIELFKKYKYYHDLNEFPEGNIKNLPAPFNKPDIVILEQFYVIKYSLKLMFELLFNNISYIIIPRSELTYDAQQHHHFRKFIFNNLILKYYSQKAIAIQYLTERERMCSRKDWNKNYIVIPNGITIPEKKKNNFFSNNIINMIAIGRLAVFQKGYDMLIEACVNIKEKLLMNNCHIFIFGSDPGDKASLGLLIKSYHLENIIELNDGIYGQNKEEKLLNSDVFLMTSRFEGLSMGLLEALSYGLPCLVTTGSNMREEIEKYNCGWGADNNVESLKKALLAILKDKDNIKIKSENARKLAGEYCWDKIGKDSHNKFLEILTKKES